MRRRRYAEFHHSLLADLAKIGDLKWASNPDYSPALMEAVF